MRIIYFPAVIILVSFFGGAKKNIEF